MKIIVEKDKYTIGKNKPYEASFGKWAEIADTKEKAIEKLENALSWYFEESAFYPLVKNANTHIVILNRDFAGYTITAINKENAKESDTNYGRISLEMAKHYLNVHVNNYL